jgi:hypothetical protein
VTYCEQLLDVELKADAKHQKDDANLRELLGQERVGDETRRIRTHQCAGEQVADNGRQTEALGDVAQYERGAKASRQRQDEIVGMHVVAS